MKFKEFFSFSKNRSFWLNLLGMALFVVAVVYGTLKGIDAYTRHGESVAVPNVTGLSTEQAIETLTLNQLKAAVIDSSYVPHAPAGSVVDQKPLAGARVKADRQVYLTICSHRTPTRTLPDVIDNSSAREAAARLLAAGFKLTANVEINGEKEWVYGVRYRGRDLTSGTKVPIGAELTLVVGSGNTTLVNDSIDTEPVDTPAEQTAGKDSDNSWF